jgi:hypothetical protein
MSISLHRGHDGKPGGGGGCSFTRDWERQVEKGSGNGVSVSVGL